MTSCDSRVTGVSAVWPGLRVAIVFQEWRTRWGPLPQKSEGLISQARSALERFAPAAGFSFTFTSTVRFAMSGGASAISLRPGGAGISLRPGGAGAGGPGVFAAFAMGSRPQVRPRSRDHRVGGRRPTPRRVM